MNEANRRSSISVGAGFLVGINVTLRWSASADGNCRRLHIHWTICTIGVGYSATVRHSLLVKSVLTDHSAAGSTPFNDPGPCVVALSSRSIIWYQGVKPGSKWHVLRCVGPVCRTLEFVYCQVKVKGWVKKILKGIPQVPHAICELQFTS